MAFEIAEREPDDGPAAGLADVRDRGCRADRGRAGRHAGGGVAANAGAGFPPHQHGLGPGDPGRSRPRVLGGYTEELSESARLQLEKLGVAVWTGMQVTGIDEEGVSIGPEIAFMRRRCSGPREWRPRRWRGRLACHSTARAAFSCSPI